MTAPTPLRRFSGSGIRLRTRSNLVGAFADVSCRNLRYPADCMELEEQTHTSEARPRSRRLSDDDHNAIRPRIGRSTRGSSLVEFALVLPMFLLMLFAVVDFARLFFVQMTLQNAVREAGRYAITGNHKPDPDHADKNLSRLASITQVAQKEAMGLDVSNLQIISVNGGKGNAGGPGDTVTISLTTDLKLLTPVAQFFNKGIYTFTVSVSFKNEPFPPANTAGLRPAKWQAIG